MEMKKRLIVVLLFLQPFITAAASEPHSYTLPRTQVIPIKDTQSNKQYELLIKLPEHYAQNKDKKYPVIYFTDAVWHIELLSSASFFMMEDVILVGISWQKDVEAALRKEHGPHVSRYRDYSFKASNNPERQAKYNFGQANHHLAFIRNDVFTYVEKNYRTEPSNRTYFGFSAGGVFGTYTLMVQPDSFKNYILGSPSIRRSIPELFSQQHAALQSKQSAINVFISYGELEKELGPHVEAFISQLKDKKYQGVSSIKHIVLESAGHSDSSPLMAMQSVKWLASLQPKEDE
jgi:predicted alpha/beta superfamily hydrolase